METPWLKMGSHILATSLARGSDGGGWVLWFLTSDGSEYMSRPILARGAMGTLVSAKQGSRHVQTYVLTHPSLASSQG